MKTVSAFMIEKDIDNARRHMRPRKVVTVVIVDDTQFPSGPVASRQQNMFREGAELIASSIDHELCYCEITETTRF